MFFEHLQPARCVFLHTQRFVINGPIMVGFVVFEHGKDDAQHLVRQPHDRLLVPLANTQGRKLVLQGTATSAGVLGEFT